jgi:Fe-S-cluster-containing hydrogenase component 2
MTTPCLQCINRSASCHSTCPAYAEYRDVQKIIKTAQRDDYIGYCADAAAKRKKGGYEK